MAASSTSRVEWYCRIANDVFGPLSTDELIAFAKQGTLSPGDMVRLGREGEWMEASTIPPLFAHLFQRRGRKGARVGDETTASAAADAIKNVHRRGLDAGGEVQGPSIVASVIAIVGSIVEGPKDSVVEGCNWLFRKLAILKRVAASKITLLVVCGVFVLLLARLLPVQWIPPRNPEEAYTAIWDELKSLRERKASDAEWDEFSTRANAELKVIVSRLEQEKSTDVGKLELLRAGRDDLPQMIDDSRKDVSASEKRFAERIRVAKFAQGQSTPPLSAGQFIIYCLLAIDGIILLFVLFFVGRKALRD